MRLNKIISIAAVVMMIFLTSNLTSGAEKGLKWFSYKEGENLLKKESKKGYIKFHADWCRYCIKMDKETFSDAKVISYLTKNFIPIKVDADTEKEIRDAYRVAGLPYSCFIDEKEKKMEIISCIPGYIDKKNFMDILKYINTDSYKKMDFNEFRKKNS